MTSLFEGYFIGLTDGCSEESCLVVFPCLSWLSFLLENIWFGSGSTMFLWWPELMYFCTLPFKIRKKAFSERLTETLQIHFNKTCQKVLQTMCDNFTPQFHWSYKLNSKRVPERESFLSTILGCMYVLKPNICLVSQNGSTEQSNILQKLL